MKSFHSRQHNWRRTTVTSKSVWSPDVLISYVNPTALMGSIVSYLPSIVWINIFSTRSYSSAS